MIAMKTKLTLLLLLLFASVVNAQFNSGQKMVGGQLGFGYYSNDQASNGKFKSTSISSTISLAKFVSPSLFNEWGVNYSYSYSHYPSNANNIDEKIYNHSFSSYFSRTKLNSLGKNFFLGFTGTGAAQFQFGKNNYITGDYDKINSYQVSINGGMGLYYKLNRRFLLNCGLSNLLSLSFNHGETNSYSGSSSINQTTSGINLSTGLSGFSFYNLNIGFRYLIK